MCLEFLIILCIKPNHPQDFLFTAAAIRRRRNESLDIEFIGIHQQMNHRLVIVGVSSANIGTNQHAWFLLGISSDGHENGHYEYDST